MSGTVVVGSLNMDLVVRTARMPLPGETVRGDGFQTIPGGKGANQAAAIALLGQRVSMVGRVGDDAFGPRLIENMSQQGVDVSHILATPGIASGNAMIIVDASAQNSIVIAPGANGLVSPADVDAVEPVLRQADFLVVQLEIPMETVAHAIKTASRHGVRIVLNPAPAADLPGGLLRLVDYMVPNETEARLLTGIDVVDLASAEGAARALREAGARNVIVTLGARGSMTVGDGAAFHTPSLEVKAVDTTAAGDAFVGGLVVGLGRGDALPDAVRFATCAGALAVTRFGAQTSLPSYAETRALYNRLYSSN